MQVLMHVFIILFIIFMGGCGKQKEHSQAKKIIHGSVPDNFIAVKEPVQKKDPLYVYSLAALELSCGNYQKALPLFLSLKEQSADSSHMYRKAYEGIIQCYDELEKNKELTLIPETVWALFQDSLDMQLIHAKALLTAANYKQLSLILANLVKKYPDNEQALYFASILNLKLAQNTQNPLERTQAFQAANQITTMALHNQNIKQKHFLFHFLASKISLMQGNLKIALSAIKKSVTLMPRFAKGWLFKALLLEQQGNINAAINGYQKFLDLVGNDEAIEKQVVSLLFSQGRFSEAILQLEKLPQKTPEYYFDHALLSWKAGKQQQSLESINMALAKRQHFTKAKLLKIEILLSAKETKEVLAFMKDWLIQQPNDNVCLQTFLLLRKTSISTKQLILTLESIIKKHPHHKLANLALTDLYFETQDYSQALAFCDKLLKNNQYAHDDMMPSKIRFQIGYIYLEMHKEQEAEKILKEALDKHPVYPPIYNLLAYHYAEKKNHLDKALHYIEKALLDNPLSAYYLDTKGFILLQQGKAEKARPILKQALSLAPQDKTIKNHFLQAMMPSE